MPAEHSIAGHVLAPFARLRAATGAVTPPLVELHGDELEWRGPDMDITVYVSRREPAIEYLVSGWLTCSRHEAIARIDRLANALEAAELVYRLELYDDGADEEPVWLRQHASFPPYPHR